MVRLSASAVRGPKFGWQESTSHLGRRRASSRRRRDGERENKKMPIPSFDKENDLANQAPTPSNPTSDVSNVISPSFTGVTGHETGAVNDPNTRRDGYHLDPATGTWVANSTPTQTPADTSGTFTGVSGHEHDPAFSTDPDPTSTSRLTDGIPTTASVAAEEAVDANASPAFAQALKDTDSAVGTNDDAKIEAQRTAVANLAGHNVHPIFPQGYEATGNASGSTPSRIVHADGVITNDERAALDAKLVAALSTTPKPEKTTPKSERITTTTGTTGTTTTKPAPFTQTPPFTPTQPRDTETFS